MANERDRRKDAKPGTDGTKPGFWRGVGRGIYNTLPKPGDWRNWRQFLDIVSEPFVPGNLYDSDIGGTVGQNIGERANNAWDRVTGLFGRDDPGAPIPEWMQPGAPMPAPDPNGWLSGLPNYNQDQTYAGPPSPEMQPYGQGQGMFPMPSQPRGPVGPQRGNTTIAQGQGAVDWARGLVMANSGLNASGGSFDELNRRARRMQR
jgi:hypothetical protein